MIKINLIPPEYKERQVQQNQKILIGGLVGITTFVLAIFLSFEKGKSSALDKKIVDENNKLEQYKLINQQIEEKERNKAKLVSKRDAIRNLNNSRLIYPVFFDDLLPLIPSDVWVSEFRLNRQSGTVLEYQFSSKALSNYALATWLSNLEQSPHFSSVKIDQINYEYSQDKTVPPVLSFQLMFSYQHKGPMPLSEYN